MPLGERLKEERERLGLSQTDFGVAAGVGRKSQFNYETEERRPDSAYLTAVAQMGVDVRYVITGARDYQPARPLTAEEQVLLDHYREASRDVRKAALGALIGASPTGPRQVFHAKVGTALAGDNLHLTQHAKPSRRKP